jgi:hypothetical protein
MPQNRRDCEITIQHPSYIKLYEILKNYEKPELRDIFLQQVAYNCAIRKVAFDFDLTITNMKQAGCLLASHQNLSSYGLDSFSEVGSIPEYDETYLIFNTKKLFFNYPFFEKYKILYRYLESEDIQRFPKVQKLLSAEQKETLKEMLSSDVDDDMVLPVFNINDSLPNELQHQNEKIALSALSITRAFYYFDALNFYDYTQSMISRSFSNPDLENENSGHDARYIKTHLNVLNPYILDKKYFTLI